MFRGSSAGGGTSGSNMMNAELSHFRGADLNTTNDEDNYFI